MRDDLRGDAAVEGQLSEQFMLWWRLDGRREYPVWGNLSAVEARALLTLEPGWPSHGCFGVTRALGYLLHTRPDLRALFDVTTEAGLWQTIAWFFVHGLHEYGLTRYVDAKTLKALDEPPPFLVAEQGRVVPTWLMFFVWRSSEHLQATFDLRTDVGRTDFLHWFLFKGVPNLRLAPLVAPRWRTWLKQPIALDALPDLTVPRAALLMWQDRADLRAAFKLDTPAGLSALAEWTQAAWQHEPGLQWIGEVEGPEPEITSSNEVRRVLATRPFGLNLIGFAFGELGIGEDVRMAVAACESAGIPFSVVNIHPGERLRQGDKALADHVTDTPDEKGEAPYALNLFCLTGFDTARVYLERGLPLFEGRYNIGWWPWELPIWPQDWQVAFDVVDEVWAATWFTHAMYSAASPGPVTQMPLPASVARVQPVSRRRLGLPESRFLFLYVFDFNSYLERKNPFAAVKAFQRAFAHDDMSVGLVLKTMNSNPKNPLWQRFVRECAKDKRIHLLQKTLDRGEVLGLIQTCDAYVSLHRSEGFGRTLAEAMLFGKPVVGTDFSGNTDFLNSETGFPVRWKKRAVKPGEYPFVTPADHAWWAEPDIAHAAQQLRRAREAAKDQTFTRRVKSFAEAQFSPTRIGRLMKERLEKIHDQRHSSPILIGSV